jgi:hypothetical protein
LSTTNPTWTNSESKPGLRGERLATNRLSYGPCSSWPMFVLVHVRPGSCSSWPMFVCSIWSSSVTILARHWSSVLVLIHPGLRLFVPAMFICSCSSSYMFVCSRSCSSSHLSLFRRVRLRPSVITYHFRIQLLDNTKLVSFSFFNELLKRPESYLFTQLLYGKKKLWTSDVTWFRVRDTVGW